MQFSLATLTTGLVLLSGIASALTADQQNALNRHNTGRLAKKVPALVWDAGLQAKAQAYANELVKKGKLEHAGVGGENLYWQSAGGDPLKNAANSWMNEEKNYSGQKIPDGNFASYGHYTQCVWKSTKKVGMASAKDAKGGTYVVARYNPAGNIVGQKPY